MKITEGSRQELSVEGKIKGIPSFHIHSTNTQNQKTRELSKQVTKIKRRERGRCQDSGVATAGREQAGLGGALVWAAFFLVVGTRDTG